MKKLLLLIIALIVFLGVWFKTADPVELMERMRAFVTEFNEKKAERVSGVQEKGDSSEKSSPMGTVAQKEEKGSWADYKAKEMVKLKDLGSSDTATGLLLKGVLINKSESRINSVIISATLYKDNKPVRKPSVFMRTLSPPLKPQAELPFDFHFKNPPEYDYYSYKIEKLTVKSGEYLE